jgi:Zn-dependent protease
VNWTACLICILPLPPWDGAQISLPNPERLIQMPQDGMGYHST